MTRLYPQPHRPVPWSVLPKLVRRMGLWGRFRHQFRRDGPRQRLRTTPSRNWCGEWASEGGFVINFGGTAPANAPAPPRPEIGAANGPLRAVSSSISAGRPPANAPAPPRPEIGAANGPLGAVSSSISTGSPCQRLNQHNPATATLCGNARHADHRGHADRRHRCAGPPRRHRHHPTDGSWPWSIPARSPPPTPPTPSTPTAWSSAPASSTPTPTTTPRSSGTPGPPRRTCSGSPP